MSVFTKWLKEGHVNQRKYHPLHNPFSVGKSDMLIFYTQKYRFLLLSFFDKELEIFLEIDVKMFV